ncbi:MAG: hypothetical protein Q8M12_05170 [bacterium]|nr:hypothetical protein [bacterium]
MAAPLHVPALLCCGSKTYEEALCCFAPLLLASFKQQESIDVNPEVSQLGFRAKFIDVNRYIFRLANVDHLIDFLGHLVQDPDSELIEFLAVCELFHKLVNVGLSQVTDIPGAGVPAIGQCPSAFYPREAFNNLHSPPALHETARHGQAPHEVHSVLEYNPESYLRE